VSFEGIKSVEYSRIYNIDGGSTPAQAVLQQALQDGPSSGWKRGWLSLENGFFEPSLGESLSALRRTPGFVWHQNCLRLPALIKTGTVMARIQEIPTYTASDDRLPDIALNAADVALCSLACAYSWSWRTAFPDKTWKIEELPSNILEPWIVVCQRLGYPQVGLSFNALCGARWRVEDSTAWSYASQYSQTVENLSAFPAIFDSRAEHVFFGVIIETMACFNTALPALVAAQEAVVRDDPHAVAAEMVKIKHMLDSLVPIFHKISVNEENEHFYVDPIVWGKTVATLHSPIDPPNNTPGASGLYVPMFHVLDEWFGRTKYTTPLGVEAKHLRSWYPPNWRDFIEAIGSPAYSVRNYAYRVEKRRRQEGQSSLPPLLSLYRSMLESYAGERGWLGTHRYKVFGFLELVFKAGRTATNGGTMEGTERGWEAVHTQLQNSRKERFHGMKYAPELPRGTAGECPFLASVSGVDPICPDETRRTALVRLSCKGSGMTYEPGDRLRLIPLSSLSEVEEVMSAMGLAPSAKVKLDEGWTKTIMHYLYAGHDIQTFPELGQPTVLAKDMLRRARLRPLFRDEVQALHDALVPQARKGAAALLDRGQFPVPCTIYGMLKEAKDTVGDTDEPVLTLTDSFLCRCFPPTRTRTYAISSSNDSKGLFPDYVEITVSRKEMETVHESVGTIPGVASGFLNPTPSTETLEDKRVLVGVERPLNFALPGPSCPIALFAGGSGIGPFRAFIQQRENQARQTGIRSENWIFFGCRNEKSFLYRDDWDAVLKRDLIDLHVIVAFSREEIHVESTPAGLKTVDGRSGKYVADVISNSKALSGVVCDLLLPIRHGGKEGYFYVCGAVPFYQGLIKVFEKITKEEGLESKASLSAAFAERRFKIEVFGSSKRLLKDGKVVLLPQVRQIWYSELAVHNASADNNEQWFAVKGGVYDVSSFYETHPGGKRIVSDVTGLDGTHVFRLVSHDVNPEVMGRMASYEIGRLRVVDKAKMASTLSRNETTAKLTDFYDLMISFQKHLASIVETENCFVNDLSSIRAMFNKGSTIALKEAHLRHHVQVLNTFVGRLCSVALPQIFGGRFGGLYDACSSSKAVLPEDIQRRLDAVCESAQEEVKWAKESGASPGVQEIGSLVLAVQDFFHFNHKKTIEGPQTDHSEFFDALHGCTIDMDFLYNCLLSVGASGMKCIKTIKKIFASALSSMEQWSDVVAEKPLGIEKVLHSLFLAFVSSKMELKMFLEESGAKCKKAKESSNVQDSNKDVSEVVSVSSLGTAWANKLDRWLKLHPDAGGKPHKKQSKERRATITVVE
jgi:sulfite reductase alpha subunit-like flavoprotein